MTSASEQETHAITVLHKATLRYSVSGCAAWQAAVGFPDKNFIGLSEVVVDFL